MITTLYLIMAEMPDDFTANLDLFVSARDLPEAITLWRDYYGIDDDFDVEDYRFRYAEVPGVSETSRVHPWDVEVAVTQLRDTPPDDWAA